MLRVIQNRNSAAAKGYYTGKPECGYYAGAGQELIGGWGGKAAERLGLVGGVERFAFERLIDNRHPETNGRLTARMRNDRTPGYDFNFHACKSATLLYALNQDPAILTAFRQAVAETMREMEQSVQTRVRTRGRDEVRTVSNMAWAEFIHLTARPVNGVIDPHLHAHCFVFNAVFDPVEHRWKAGQFRELKANAPKFERAFHARFAWKLMELGYPIERKGQRWEIAGIDRATLEKFALRTRQVEEYARDHGIDDPAEKDRIGARLRSRKRRDIGMDELRQEWRARLSDREREAFSLATLRRGITGTSPLPSLNAGLPPGLADRQRPEACRAFLAARHRQRRAEGVIADALLDRPRA